VQLLNILQLTTAQLDLADRYRLPERVLREILSAPQDQWERLIRMSIQNQLTSDEIAEVSEPPAPLEKPYVPPVGTSVLPEPDILATRSLRKFGRVLGELDRAKRDNTLDSVADTLISLGDADYLLELLQALTRVIQSRLLRQ
jgi:hypothetical protein